MAGLLDYPTFAQQQAARRQADPQGYGLLGPSPGNEAVGQGLLGLLPGIGDAMSVNDAYEGVRDRDWLKAGLGALGALPMIPAVGGMMRAADTGSGAAKAMRELTVDEAADMILRRIGDKAGDFDHYGIRITEEPLSVGGTAPPSRVWDNGDPTEDMLSGASVVRFDPSDRASLVKALEIAGVKPKSYQGYFGEHLSVLGGHYAETGQDMGEAILRDGVVLDALKRMGVMGPLGE